MLFKKYGEHKKISFNFMRICYSKWYENDTVEV